MNPRLGEEQSDEEVPSPPRSWPAGSISRRGDPPPSFSSFLMRKQKRGKARGWRGLEPESFGFTISSSWAETG